MAVTGKRPHFVTTVPMTRLLAEVVDMRRFLVLGLICLLGVGALAADVTVTYLGHSCFTVQEEGGPTVMMDPYSSFVAYPALPKPADIVLISHDHVDHDPASFGEFDRVTGDPVYVRRLGTNGRCREAISPNDLSVTDGFQIQVIEGDHVNVRGGGAGYVCMYTFDVGGIRFAHLGDLGRTLNDRQIAALSGVDVLFAPVGGAFTLNAQEAMTAIGQIPSLKIAIPMHYRVTGITPWLDIAPLSTFTQYAGSRATVVDKNASSIVISADTLPTSTEIWLMDYER